jgi:KRAB domain-containing zinc finger protein
MTTYECTKCDKTFKRQSNLTQHQRMHNGTAFACELCERQFDWKGNLERHLIAHTFAKPYVCDVDTCEQKFALKSNMQQHKRDVHEKVPGKYRCEQCAGRTFSVPAHLRIHVRTHTNERPFACLECAMKFNDKSNLQVHFRAAHTSERPYACAHCERTFASSTYRNRHQQRNHK